MLLLVVRLSCSSTSRTAAAAVAAVADFGIYSLFATMATGTDGTLMAQCELSKLPVRSDYTYTSA